MAQAMIVVSGLIGQEIPITCIAAPIAHQMRFVADQPPVFTRDNLLPRATDGPQTHFIDLALEEGARAIPTAEMQRRVIAGAACGRCSGATGIRAVDVQVQLGRVSNRLHQGEMMKAPIIDRTGREDFYHLRAIRLRGIDFPAAAPELR
jgi:hypothetical protein